METFDGWGGGGGELPLNILFITADDLGWKSLGSHGAIDHCRNLADLAATSRVFPWAFNATSSCSSSRASFATGQFPSQHGVTGLVHRHPELSLDPRAFTLPRALAEYGYATGIAGKYHLSDVEPAETFGYSDVGPKKLNNTNFIEEFLLDHLGTPFYLELNFKQTHRRGTPRRFPIDPAFPVTTDQVRVPDYWALPDIEGIRQCLAGYLSQFCAMDALIGQTLRLLERLSLRQRTVVLFVSDNGVSIPNNKMTLYDRGTGSPCLFSDPRDDFVGVDTSLVSSIDYAPTLLDAAGIGVRGLDGQRLGAISRDAVFSEMFMHRNEVGMRAVRTADWKLIANVSTEPIGAGEVTEPWELELEHRPWANARPQFELYDLQADPHEQANVLDQHPDAAQVLYARLAEHHANTGDPVPLPPLPV